MKSIKLTDPERLILANQYELLSILLRDEFYKEVSDNLHNGHEWIYSQYLEVSPVLPEQDVEYVLKILQIYSDLKDSYEGLVDKFGIDKSDVIFPGFDGNTETHLLVFSTALRLDGKFETVLGKEAPNSHIPTTAMYKRMIEKWREIGFPTFPYNKNTIIQILSVRTHP